MSKAKKSKAAPAKAPAKAKGATMTLTDNATGKSYELPVIKGTVGPSVIDVRKLYAETGHFTYDPGFTSTGSCESKITYIDGDKGVLLYVGAADGAPEIAGATVIGIGFGIVSVVLSYFLGPRNPTPEKLAPYECGMPPVGDDDLGRLLGGHAERLLAHDMLAGLGELDHQRVHSIVAWPWITINPALK